MSLDYTRTQTQTLKLGFEFVLKKRMAVGAGPVGEFRTIAVNIIDEGIIWSGSKKLLFFKGQADHHLPVHNHSLQVTGKMLGHSVLHGGPGLHGVSPRCD